MPKTCQRRKLPVTLAEKHESSTPRASRTVIRKFHTLLKQQKNATGDTLANVNREIEKLGGLDKYQRMSCIGQGNDRGGGSEKVLIGWLRQMGWADGKEKGKHRLLEVGAVTPDNYRGCAFWIDVTSIDLHSRHPSILEQDFLLMDQSQHREAWDIISLSLVLNFVPDGKDRGTPQSSSPCAVDCSRSQLPLTLTSDDIDVRVEITGRMLVRAHSMIRSGGLCFIALPLPCVNNSRYMTLEHMRELMNAIGFSQLEERWKSGGKMVYWLYQRQPSPESHEGEHFRRKKVLRQGANRNNFHVVLV